MRDLFPLHTTGSDSVLALLENTTAISAGVKTQQLYRTGTYYTAATGTRATSGNTAAYFISTFAATSPDGLRERVTVLDNGNVGIGTTAPSSTLDVNGTLRFRQGASNGALLTSDANGNATWQVPASNPVRAAAAWVSPTFNVGASQTRTIRFGSSEFSNGIIINDSTIIIPTTGIYQFTLTFGFISSNVLDGDPNKLITFRIQPSASPGKSVLMQPPASASFGNTVFYSTQLLSLTANDTVKITCSSPAGYSLALTANTQFNGIAVHLIQ